MAVSVVSGSDVVVLESTSMNNVDINGLADQSINGLTSDKLLTTSRPHPSPKHRKAPSLVSSTNMLIAVKDIQYILLTN